MLVAALLGCRTASGLGGDEMVAVDKTDNFYLPWRGPAARAALPYGDDQMAPSAMAGGIALLAAECVASPLLRVGLWPVHPFADTPLFRRPAPVPPISPTRTPRISTWQASPPSPSHPPTTPSSAGGI